MQTWDPLKNPITVGSHTVKGYGEGTYITATFNEAQWIIRIGADGTPTRTRNANRSGKITITLQRESKSNTYLVALAKLDYASALGVVPLLVKDNNNTANKSFVLAEQAWIEKMPDFERAKESGDIVWTFETGFLDMEPGGTDDITQSVPNIPQP